MTLQEAMRQRGNNFDFLRFVAALLVILSHCFDFVYAPVDYCWAFTGWNSFGTFGLCIFFTISGFLVTKSWDDDPRLFAFVKKRFLRIFPGLLGAALFCVLVIGPLATTLSMSQYFHHPQTWHYFWTLLLFNAQSLPGVFTANHYPNAVNGSLWTLPLEALCYTLVVALGSLGILKARNAPVLLLIALHYFNANYALRPDPSNWVSGWIVGPANQNCYSYFLVGMIFYQYRDRIVLSTPACTALLLLVFASWKTPHVQLILLAALPYLLFYFVYVAFPRLHRFAKYGDFSYGLYIYAFPIQQYFTHRLGDHIAWYKLFAVAIGPILAMAVVSWYGIERPALRLKGQRGNKREEADSGPSGTLSLNSATTNSRDEAVVVRQSAA